MVGLACVELLADVLPSNTQTFFCPASMEPMIPCRTSGLRYFWTSGIVSWSSSRSVFFPIVPQYLDKEGERNSEYQKLDCESRSLALYLLVHQSSSRVRFRPLFFDRTRRRAMNVLVCTWLSQLFFSYFAQRCPVSFFVFSPLQCAKRKVKQGGASLRRTSGEPQAPPLQFKDTTSTVDSRARLE